MEDYYAVLGVSPSASYHDIKAAFRRAALSHHPDKTSTASEEFLRIQNAWNVLGNVSTRAAYDQQRALAQARSAAIHINDVVSLEEFQHGVDMHGSVVLSHACRCGGLYSVTETQLTTLLSVDTDACNKSNGIMMDSTHHEEGSRESMSRQRNGSQDIVLPCSTCSLYISVILP